MVAVPEAVAVQEHVEPRPHASSFEQLHGPETTRYVSPV